MNRTQHLIMESKVRHGLNFQVGIAGYCRLRKYKAATDELVQDTGWFKNLITNDGMDALALQADVMVWFHVGTSNTDPQQTDTWVNGFVASTNTVREDINGVSPGSPYYGFRRKTCRFDVGVAEGNLQECAVGWSSTTGTAFSHALIRDALGVAISITVAADEYLDFTYELRYYAPVADATGTVTIDGVSYNYATRALAVTNTFWWSQGIGKKITYNAAFENYHRPYTGELQAVTDSQPAGTDATGTKTLTVATYVDNSHKREFVVSAAPSEWNVAGGVIRSVVLGCTCTRWQTRLGKVSDDSGVTKNSGFGLFINWSVSWTRV